MKSVELFLALGLATAIGVTSTVSVNANDYTDEQVEQMKANVTPLLTAVPESGTNDIIVGHDDIFESATGIYPAPQGMAYVVKPDGNGGFELIANMLPEEWAEL